mmetsp:Transcript_27323/g.59738  ORF Transcript_27323/g.59738 Transcript_27323/m.59738 type:complete len:231 (-) Transcript_27323:1113-1805(-)
MCVLVRRAAGGRWRHEGRHHEGGRHHWEKWRWCHGRSSLWSSARRWGWGWRHSEHVWRHGPHGGGWELQHTCKPWRRRGPSACTCPGCCCPCSRRCCRCCPCSRRCCCCCCCLRRLRCSCWLLLWPGLRSVHLSTHVCSRQAHVVYVGHMEVVGVVRMQVGHVKSSRGLRYGCASGCCTLCSSISSMCSRLASTCCSWSSCSPVCCVGIWALATALEHRGTAGGAVLLPL